MNNHPFAGQEKKSRVSYINMFPDVISSSRLQACPRRTEPYAQEEVLQPTRAKLDPGFPESSCAAPEEAFPGGGFPWSWLFLDQCSLEPGFPGAGVPCRWRSL